MTDQPIANSELAEQLTSLSDRLYGEISQISDLLARTEQLYQSVQAAETRVTAIRQEVSGVPDRLGALETQLGQLLDSLPRLAQDVKNFARLAQHMDQCANEVHQWYQELKQGQTGGETEGKLLELENALNSYRESHQALVEQVALLQSREVDQAKLEELEGSLSTIGQLATKLQELENSLSAIGQLEGRLQGLENSLNALAQRLEQPITSGSPIDEGQLGALVERIVGEREQALRQEMTTMQRDWQDGAAILQQMQVRIESLESRGGDATTAQLEAIRTEMANLVAKAKTEQETALRDQRRQLEELSSQGGKTTLALILGVVALGLGIFGFVRR
jgi:DNA repair exonuclease SbcCD ATPase subunit